MPFDFVFRQWSKPVTRYDVYYQRISGGQKITEHTVTSQGETIKELKNKVVADLSNSRPAEKQAEFAESSSPESFYMFRRERDGIFDGMVFDSTLVGESFHNNKQEPLFLLHTCDLIVFQFVDWESRQTFPFNHMVYMGADVANKGAEALVGPLSNFFRGTRELFLEIDGTAVPVAEVKQGALRPGTTCNVLAKLK